MVESLTLCLLLERSASVEAGLVVFFERHTHTPLEYIFAFRAVHRREYPPLRSAVLISRVPLFGSPKKSGV